MPLPAKVLSDIRTNLANAEKTLKELDEHLADAKRAGIDVAEQIKKADATRQQIAQMRMVYGA
jgi:hypothetical protein